MPSRQTFQQQCYDALGVKDSPPPGFTPPPVPPPLPDPVGPSDGKPEVPGEYKMISFGLPGRLCYMRGRDLVEVPRDPDGRYTATRGNTFWIDGGMGPAERYHQDDAKYIFTRRAFVGMPPPRLVSGGALTVFPDPATGIHRYEPWKALGGFMNAQFDVNAIHRAEVVVDNFSLGGLPLPKGTQLRIRLCDWAGSWQWSDERTGAGLRLINAASPKRARANQQTTEARLLALEAKLQPA